jgi:hypothetical protein
MTKTFTYDDVVRYVYAETTAEENMLIVEALAANDDLMNFYLDSLELHKQMNLLMTAPSNQTINNILDFSYSYPSSQPADIPA